jgi:hypothetical protein
MQEKADDHKEIKEKNTKLTDKGSLLPLCYVTL